MAESLIVKRTMALNRCRLNNDPATSRNGTHLTRPQLKSDSSPILSTRTKSHNGRDPSSRNAEDWLVCGRRSKKIKSQMHEPNMYVFQLSEFACEPAPARGKKRTDFRNTSDPIAQKTTTDRHDMIVSNRVVAVSIRNGN